MQKKDVFFTTGKYQNLTDEEIIKEIRLGDNIYPRKI